MSVEWTILTPAQRARRRLTGEQHETFVGSYEVTVEVDQPDCDVGVSLWVWRVNFEDGPCPVIEHADGYFAGTLNSAKARAVEMATLLTTMLDPSHTPDQVGAPT